jgi:hypothetical protein
MQWLVSAAGVVLVVWLAFALGFTRDLPEDDRR